MIVIWNVTLNTIKNVAETVVESVRCSPRSAVRPTVKIPETTAPKNANVKQFVQVCAKNVKTENVLMCPHNAN